MRDFLAHLLAILPVKSGRSITKTREKQPPDGTQGRENMKQKITMAYVEKYIAKHPEKRNIRSAQGRYTYFNQGADENGYFEDPDQVKPGCVFGHIIRSLGGGPEDVFENSTIIVSNEHVLSNKLTPTDKEILDRTQSYADSYRLTWGEALQRAKEVNRAITTPSQSSQFNSLGIENWTDRDYVQAALDMLPDDVEDIKAFLKTQRVKGAPRDSYYCPIAQWIMRWTDHSADTNYKGVLINNQKKRIPLPFEASDFIYALDSGDIRY